MMIVYVHVIHFVNETEKLVMFVERASYVELLEVTMKKHLTCK